MYNHRQVDLFLVPNRSIITENLGLPPGMLNLSTLMNLLSNDSRKRRDVPAQLSWQPGQSEAHKRRQRRDHTDDGSCSGDGMSQSLFALI